MASDVSQDVSPRGRVGRGKGRGALLLPTSLEQQQQQRQPARPGRLAQQSAPRPSLRPALQNGTRSRSSSSSDEDDDSSSSSSGSGSSSDEEEEQGKQVGKQAGKEQAGKVVDSSSASGSGSSSSSSSGTSSDASESEPDASPAPGGHRGVAGWGSGAPGSAGPSTGGSRLKPATATTQQATGPGRHAGRTLTGLSASPSAPSTAPAAPSRTTQVQQQQQPTGPGSRHGSGLAGRDAPAGLLTDVTSLLEGVPMVGDVLAYQLLEMGLDCCPRVRGPGVEGEGGGGHGCSRLISYQLIIHSAEQHKLTPVKKILHCHVYRHSWH